jgi:flavin-dependent dehydrogenase
LAAAGRDVLVVDAAVFPRDKPCAGWITPEVLEELPFSMESYAEEHVAQPISRFRVGRIGGRVVDVDYATPVSYGIRRSEFDAELLRRSGARVREGERVRTVERAGGAWVLNGALAAPVLVGAGGHFCPVARRLGGPADDASVVVAREIEFRLSEEDASRCEVAEDRPELYFCEDLRGYGWCFRKANYLNVGLGRLDSLHLPDRVQAFLEFLRREKRISRIPDDGWHGHAYRIRQGRPGRVSGDGLLLVGDAAGLAAPASGEGILPARVSGRLAAEAILDSRIADFAERLEARFGPTASSRWLPDRVAGAIGAALFAMPGLARRLVLDRWFLHRSGRRQEG